MNVEEAIDYLVHTCFDAADKAGWWPDHEDVAGWTDPHLFPTKTMLVVTELAEAIEADRTNSFDNKLTHRKGAEVELADALIRICDLAGAYGFDLGGAVAEKMAYNKTRLDHKPENRQKKNGKRY